MRASNSSFTSLRPAEIQSTMVVPSYQAPCGDADNKLLPEEDGARSVYRIFHTSCKDLKNGTYVKRDARKRKVRDDEIIIDTKARLVVDAEYSCRSDKAIKVASVNQKGGDLGSPS